MYDPELAIKYWKLWQARQCELKINVVSAKEEQLGKIIDYLILALIVLMGFAIMFWVMIRNLFWCAYVLLIVTLIVDIIMSRVRKHLLNQHEELVNEIGRVLDDD